MMKKLYLIPLILFILTRLITGCTAQYPLNIKMEAGSVVHDISPPRNDDSNLILILAFSGGGTRAASLAYGTLEALQQVELQEQTVSTFLNKQPKTLLNHVALITAVSGGSFTAAYYGLHGEEIFKDFRERFLMRNVQGDLLGKLFNPYHWPRLTSPRFGRSDLAQEYYDEILFNGATLSDMSGVNRPHIVILATDALEGVSFPFTANTFGWICSDFSRFPVSRAVTASSALPGILSPVILHNFSKTCKNEIPLWIQKALDNPDHNDRTYQTAVRANAYLDQDKKPFIFLLDGGIADNLGLRAIIDNVSVYGGIRDVMAKSPHKGIRRIAFVIVDAETKVSPSWSILDNIPGVGTILGVSSTIMVNKYNFETIDLLRRTIRDWQSEAAASMNPIDFYLIHITFNSLPDKSKQEYFHSIPTSFSLSADQVDRLRDAATHLLHASPEFQRLIRDMNGQIMRSPVGIRPSGKEDNP